MVAFAERNRSWVPGKALRLSFWGLPVPPQAGMRD